MFLGLIVVNELFIYDKMFCCCEYGNPIEDKRRDRLV